MPLVNLKSSLIFNNAIINACIVVVVVVIVIIIIIVFVIIITVSVITAAITMRYSKISRNKILSIAGGPPTNVCRPTSCFCSHNLDFDPMTLT